MAVPANHVTGDEEASGVKSPLYLSEQVLQFKHMMERLVGEYGGILFVGFPSIKVVLNEDNVGVYPGLSG